MDVWVWLWLLVLVCMHVHEYEHGCVKARWGGEGAHITCVEV